MLKRLSVALGVLLLLSGTSAFASEKYGWNPEKGKKLFISRLKKKCKPLKIKKLTQSHTQKEWKEIIANGELEEELKKQCPAYEIGSLTPKQVADFGDAMINYAKDSYNIPS